VRLNLLKNYGKLNRNLTFNNELKFVYMKLLLYIYIYIYIKLDNVDFCKLVLNVYFVVNNILVCMN